MSSFLASASILQILPALEQGGVERGTIEMAQAITQAGGKALVISAGGRMEPLLRHSGAEHITLPDCGSRNPLKIAKNSHFLSNIIRQHNVQLVHARSRAPAWVAKMACKRTKTPFVTTWHGVHANSFPGKRHYNAVLASGDRVIAISNHIAQRLAEEYHVGPDRLRTIPRGADTDQFSPQVVSGQRVHRLVEAWALPADAPIILMPGRLTAWKGQSLVLDALAQLLNLLPDINWHCVFAGGCAPKDKYAQELSTKAAQLGLTDRVRFAGHCDDMPAAMMLANMVVVPSLRPEPFGRVVVEAQAMCCPVIVAHHGAAVETVANGQTGFSFTPENANELAQAIYDVLAAPPEILEEIGYAARQMVLSRYSTFAMQHATLAVYDELLGTALAEHFAGIKNDPALFQEPTFAG